MTSVLITDRRGDIDTEEGPCEHGGGYQSDTATSPGILGATSSCKRREDPPLGPSEGSWPC